MKNIERNNIFILPNGEEVKVAKSHQGRYLKLPIEVKYEDPELQHKNQPMDDIWKNENYKKCEEAIFLANKDTNKIANAIRTSIVAEMKDWKEYETVKHCTGERAFNCTYKVVLEILFMEEEWSRRILVDYGPGKYIAHPFSVSSLEEYVYELLLDEDVKDEYFVKDGESGEDSFSLEFYTEDGDSTFIEFENSLDVGRRIVSARIVEFEETIVS